MSWRAYDPATKGIPTPTLYNPRIFISIALTNCYLFTDPNVAPTRGDPFPRLTSSYKPPPCTVTQPTPTREPVHKRASNLSQTRSKNGTYPKRLIPGLHQRILGRRIGDIQRVRHPSACRDADSSRHGRARRHPHTRDPRTQCECELEQRGSGIGIGIAHDTDATRHDRHDGDPVARVQ